MEQRIAEQSNLPAIQSKQPVINSVPTEHELLTYQTYAKTAVESQMYRGIGKEAGVMMILLAAREYGISPCQALNNGIRIIEGNVELSARMMSALIRRAKHSMQVIETTDTKCTIKGIRRDNGDELTVTYTIEMAQKAGLIKEKGAWKRTPEDMLFARAVSRLARQLFSDVVGIGYIEGEIDDSGASEPVLIYEEDCVYEFNNLCASLLIKSSEEHHNFEQFVASVAIHYKWTLKQTVAEFSKDIDKTQKAFQAWKQKK